MTSTQTPTRREVHDANARERGWASTSWRALGTGVELVTADRHGLIAAADAVRTVLDDIDRAASRFRLDSELTAVNEAAGATCPVSPLLARALRVALDAAAWTGGLVDPTIGASLISAGYDRSFRLLPPDRPALTVSLERAPGWRVVELDEEKQTVRVPSGVRLDLGATAKALAADLAAERAAEVAGCGVLISLGGDLSVAGPVPMGGWPVRIVDVADPELAADDEDLNVLLHGGGVATSGTAARRWQRGGDWLHHIIDPRHGGPADSPWRTASVAGSTCTLANAASTAAVILGPSAPAWLQTRGLAFRLAGPTAGVVVGGGWPTEDGVPS